MPTVKARTNCLVCNGRTDPILTLGEQCLSDFMDDGRHNPPKIPLDLRLCGQCWLLQLAHVVKRDDIYRHYWYQSGISDTMRRALANIVESATEEVDLEEGDVVVDIGSSDGTLLRCYSPTMLKIGFEPAKNIYFKGEVNHSIIINDYFTRKAYNELFAISHNKRKGKSPKAKIITAIAMFYDLEYPHRFVADVRSILADNGVFIVQMNYLPSMLKQNAFDNISHEHLQYYSLGSLQYLLDSHGLEVFDLELNEINGGSFRCYIGHKGKRRVMSSVRRLKMREYKLADVDIYQKFSARVNRIKAQVVSFIQDCKRKGETVYLYGASSRGNVLLQYFGLDHTLITAAAERDPTKFGKMTVATKIPIVSEDNARRAKPDYFLMLPWAFAEEFISRERKYLDGGGKFIVPLPKFRIVGLRQ